MKMLIGYVTRLFLQQVAVTLFGLVALLQLFDMLNNADRVLSRHGGGLDTLLRYASLRLPELISFLLPFAVLLAALMLLAKLAQQAEIVAMKAAGISYYRLLLAFLPIGLAIAVAHFVFADQVAPRSARILAEWDAEVEGQAVRGAGELVPGIWIRDGSTLARVTAVYNAGANLADVTLFRRDGSGNLVERITADRAIFEGDSWRLTGVERLTMEAASNGRFERLSFWRWETSLTPGHFSDLAAPPASLTLAELSAFANKDDLGDRPTYYYETWRQKRLALPVVGLIMILLAAPVAQSLQRQRNMVWGLVAGVAMAFLYFVTDGLLLAFGESGVLPPIAAAWSPALLFAFLGLAGLLKIEGN